MSKPIILKDVCSLGFANRVIDRCKKEGVKNLTNLKLQKLCYLIYQAYYKKYNKLLFCRSEIKFWKCGVVILRPYDSLKCNGNNPIKYLISDIDPFCDNGDKFTFCDIDKSDECDNIVELIKLLFQLNCRMLNLR